MPVHSGPTHVAKPKYWQNGVRVFCWATVIGAFVMDMLMQSGPAYAVLYLPILMVIGAIAGENEVFVFGILCGMLTLATFAADQSVETGSYRATHSVSLIAAISLTTMLLMRAVKSKAELATAKKDLNHSEWRYRVIFQQTRFPLWERDFSGAFTIYEELRAKGVKNLLEHARLEPDLPHRLAASIITLEVNDAMMKMFNAKTHEEVPRTLAGMKPNPISLLKLHQALYDGERLLDGKSNLVTIDGQYKEVWVTSELSPDPARPGITVGLLIDLSEAEKTQKAMDAAQAELARASRVATVSALSASIAHEINQPLAAIILNAQTCLRYLNRLEPDIAAARAAVERVVTEGERAGEIVRFTRNLVTGDGSQEQMIDLGGLIREAISLLGHQVFEAAVAVDFDLPTEPVLLNVDRIAMQQVVVNLAANAIQAMADWHGQRQIMLTLRNEGHFVLIAIRDTGPGIESTNLERIFEGFFTTKKDGIGVGLVICKATIEACGGTLRAYNHTSGGAVFECRIPQQHASS